MSREIERRLRRLEGPLSTGPDTLTLASGEELMLPPGGVRALLREIDGKTRGLPNRPVAGERAAELTHTAAVDGV